MATLKKTENWFSRPIIASCRSKVLQNAPRGECSKGSILQYFRPSLSYHIYFVYFWVAVLHRLFCILMSSSIWFDTISLGWFIVHIKGSQIRISKLRFNPLLHNKAFWRLWNRSTVAQWKSAWLETKGPRVRASPASLCCVLEQDTFILA